MKILLVLGHPDRESFNHALAKAVQDALLEDRHEVVFHDLYAEGFEAALPREEIPRNGKVDAEILNHCRDLEQAEGIVVIHPNWWGAPPALVKGWIDRVFRPDVAYRFEEGDGGEGVPVGLLQAKTAVVLNTSNTGEKRESEIFGDPLQSIWQHCVFGLCGTIDVRRRTFSIVCTSTAEQRAKWLEEARQLVRESFPSAHIQQ